MTSFDSFTQMLDILAEDAKRPGSPIRSIDFVPARDRESAPEGGEPTADHPPAVWSPTPPSGSAACVLCGCLIHPKFRTEHLAHCPATVPSCCKSHP